MKFENYGNLEWLEPEDFYADAWYILDTDTAEDGETYDIVLLKKSDDDDIIRYTTI